MTLKATAQTDKASRYLQQLSKHWGHKFHVDFTPEQSTIKLPIGEVFLQAGDAALYISLEPENDDSADKLKDVVVQHIDRFAAREGGLVYVWDQNLE
ncbi:DUF2218 domain-containing protein [Parvularcula flava]|uniref:DUF2218 domain-containing protein n=1 Tax=Aquisalinus luteolus TaxID=1566827 RepID=A0A8J3EPQ9_9PROT|nr:DUF2218 domain-containing protein [Aquisalinus luteolus]NHK28734.1 DUF2218 domain-containing protein [Aquisalinus luteolus]GGH99359.1 hypothetical protein GCM10011355_25130 [Aquisalinus luteolus]